MINKSDNSETTQSPRDAMLLILSFINTFRPTVAINNFRDTLEINIPLNGTATDELLRPFIDLYSPDMSDEDARCCINKVLNDKKLEDTLFYRRKLLSFKDVSHHVGCLDTISFSYGYENLCYIFALAYLQLEKDFNMKYADFVEKCLLEYKLPEGQDANGTLLGNTISKEETLCLNYVSQHIKGYKESIAFMQKDIAECNDTRRIVIKTESIMKENRDYNSIKQALFYREESFKSAKAMLALRKLNHSTRNTAAEETHEF